MSRPPLLVAGLVNIETTLKIEGFPLDYQPVRYPFFGVGSSVSGVGVNLALALHALGSPPRLLTLVGRDPFGDLAERELRRQGVHGPGVLAALAHTPQSVILYEPSGRRQVNVDLKDIQEAVYPLEIFKAQMAGCGLAALCNINFARPFLAVARQAGAPIATDVHAIDDLDDPYNRDFMAAAQVLFQSHERLPCSPEEWAGRVFDRYPAEVVVVGMGAQGALLAVRGGQRHSFQRVAAVQPRPVVSTIGAGDALFACFIHEYAYHRDASRAIRRAVWFAGYKIGVASAAEGFLTAAELDQLCPTD